MAYSPSELQFLIEHLRAVEEFIPTLSLAKKDALGDGAAARARFGEQGRAVVELARARQSGEGKFPSSWLSDSDAAQQATHRAVAQQRAHLISQVCGPGELVHDLTCSIGTEALAIEAAGFNYVGSDLDATRVAMANVNLEGRVFQADALSVTAPGAQVLLADPARRAGGRRITAMEELLPPLPELLAAHAGSEIAIKCAPGIDYSEWEGLVSVLSVDASVKEACLYTPGFGRGREARVLKTRADGDFGGDDLFDVEVISSLDSAEISEDAAPGEFILDPDGAIVRAGLVRHYAHRHGLWMLDPQIAYLTGDALPPGRSGFRILEAVSPKKLKAALRALGAGSVEILVRGIDQDPDLLRKKLQLKGDNALAVVLTRIGRDAVAFICGPRQWAPPKDPTVQ